MSNLNIEITSNDDNPDKVEEETVVEKVETEPVVEPVAQSDSMIDVAQTVGELVARVAALENDTAQALLDAANAHALAESAMRNSSAVEDAVVILAEDIVVADESEAVDGFVESEEVESEREHDETPIKTHWFKRPLSEWTR